MRIRARGRGAEKKSTEGEEGDEGDKGEGEGGDEGGDGEGDEAKSDESSIFARLGIRKIRVGQFEDSGKCKGCGRLSLFYIFYTIN